MKLTKFKFSLKLLQILLILNLKIVGTFGDPQFYASCAQTALQGLGNLGSLFPMSRAGEDHACERYLKPPNSKIPTEFGKAPTTAEDDEKGEVLANVTTKLVLDRDANNAVYQTGLEYLNYPKEVLKDRIRYLLFTNVSKNEYQIMQEDGTTIGTFWSPDRKTKVLIHGLTSTYWYSAVKNIWLQHIFEIKDAYLSPDNLMKAEYNVVVVDWTSLSSVPMVRYPDAAVGSRVAAEDLADFLVKLKLAGNIRSMDDVHLLGHSLGAHAAGIVGQKLLEIDPEYMLPRITGLDPAGPCFDKPSASREDMDWILDKSDAKFVDIIHTNMGDIIQSVAGRYGSTMETGHVDFYPNGGETQTGCSFLENMMGFCSHQKSVAFYGWSIKKRFMACPCPNWDSYGSEECACSMRNGGQYFGEHIDHFARGKFFLPL